MASFIDISLYSSATARSGFLDWLKEVSKSATLEDFDPLLKPIQTSDGYVNPDGTPYQEFDYMQTIPDFATLSGVGDPRFSLGHMLSAALDEFIPRINLYTEVLQAGGCQVIEDYICDANGTPIQKISSSCPDGLSPVQSQEIIDFVTNTYASKIDQDIIAFTDYVKKNFIENGYTVRLLIFKTIEYKFLVEAKKDTDTKYLKYYYSDKDRISEILNIPITVVDPLKNSGSISNPKSSQITVEMIQAISSPVESYK